MTSRNCSAKAFSLVLLMLISLTMPMVSLLPNASAGGGSVRHIYTFTGGDVEATALYQGAGADATNKISVPKGAEVIDVEMTLQGASATGWSQVDAIDRSDWMEGEAISTDSRSDELTLGLSSATDILYSHPPQDELDANNSAWLDDGSYALRQPHTGNTSEGRFNPQSQVSSSNFMSQGQGALLKHHGWLFMSTWSGTSFEKMIKRLWPNNGSVESTLTLEQGSCTLPSNPSSTYYAAYGFRDWTVTPDEKLYGIFSTYRYHYGSSAPVQHHRVLEIDVRYDDVWKCLDSYDISPQLSEYTGIGYDRVNDKIWVVHGTQRKLVSYEFLGGGQFDRGSTIYTFSQASSGTLDCGKAGGFVRGLAVHGDMFWMRCKKGTSSWSTTDVLNAWAVSPSSNLLIGQSGIRNINQLGYGMYYDGQRLHTLDCGYYTWGGSTLYYRQFGSGIPYSSTATPGTSTWLSEPLNTDEEILAINMETHWSAPSTGDRVDYWISADNGTHWQAVESNVTLHLSHPGKVLRWKAQLIGSSAVSWWADLQYAEAYASTGSWTSPSFPTGTEIGLVKPVWSADVPSGTEMKVFVSNNNGSDWDEVPNNTDWSFTSNGSQLRYSIQMESTNSSITPKLDQFVLRYLEAFPNKVQLDIGDDTTWDWRGLTFLSQGISVIASDDSVVGQDVSIQPTMVDAFNQHIPSNGIGSVDIPIAVKAAESGRVKMTNLDLSYRMKTRVLDASLDGGTLAPDDEWRTLEVRVAKGDEAERIMSVVVELENSHGDSPSLKWQLGDTCQTLDDASGIVQFDDGNCTSVENQYGVRTLRIPVKVNWTWNDEIDMQARVTVDDDIGRAVNSWQTEALDLRVENDLQLDGLRVFDANERELLNHDWMRGGENMTFSGGIHFEGTSISPKAGEFTIQISGQNLTPDGDPIGAPVVLHEEPNPSHGEYSITLIAPMESTPGGMLFQISAINTANGSVYANPDYNTLRVVLDGNSPLLVSATPEDGSEVHKGSPDQSIEIVIQDSVDPPSRIDLHYWLGCKSRHEKCSDTNFNGLPEPLEYRTMTLTSPEVKAGGINIFEGQLEDSMLLHGEVVTFYVSGTDGQGNQVAMGGSTVCPDSPSNCGWNIGENAPNWDASLVTYSIREEFEPELNPENSTIVGHNDKSPLHPGIPYNLVLQLGDMNGWSDIQRVRLALAGDFDDDETMITVEIMEGEMGQPDMDLSSGGAGLAVSNLYSVIAEDLENSSRVFINIRFQLTWAFPEKWDTNGESFFIPKMEVTDRACGLDLSVPCHEARIGMGNDLWSLDNDLRFDLEQGHIKAVELRNGMDHYHGDETTSLIGSGQALRFSGRVLFSEDSTPAPAGSFDIVLGDLEHQWRTTPREGGYFSLDMLVPEVRSGRLDLWATMEEMPGLATDETTEDVRLRFIVDNGRPIIDGISISGVLDGESIPLSSISEAQVVLSTSDDHGFDLDTYPTMHYLLRAGASEVSRGSLPLSEGLDVDGEVFWSAIFDIGDTGATQVLPTYTLDVWVTGADASGNPFDATGNTESQPVASFSFIRTGPILDLMAEDTTMVWSDPSPAPGDAVHLELHGFNTVPMIGELRFVLEQNIDGDWIEVSQRNATVKGESEIHVILPFSVPDDSEGSLEFRIREFDQGFELDRKSTTPLFISDDVMRDGDALAQQVSDSGLSVLLYLVALGCAIYGIWMMVLYRDSIRPDDEEGLDQTSDVMHDLSASKELPPLTPEPAALPAPDMQAALPAPPPPNMQAALPGSTPPPPDMSAALPAQPAAPSPAPAPADRGLAPIPAEGLPPGWTDDQWQHYGWTWLEQQGRA